jgi:hypothetical protein
VFSTLFVWTLYVLTQLPTKYFSAFNFSGFLKKKIWRYWNIYFHLNRKRVFLLINYDVFSQNNYKNVTQFTLLIVHHSKFKWIVMNALEGSFVRFYWLFTLQLTPTIEFSNYTQWICYISKTCRLLFELNFFSKLFSFLNFFHNESN